MNQKVGLRLQRANRSIAKFQWCCVGLKCFASSRSNFGREMSGCLTFREQEMEGEIDFE